MLFLYKHTTQTHTDTTHKHTHTPIHTYTHTHTHTHKHTSIPFNCRAICVSLYCRVSGSNNKVCHATLAKCLFPLSQTVANLRSLELKN